VEGKASLLNSAELVLTHIKDMKMRIWLGIGISVLIIIIVVPAVVATR
jgi:hypothetical protein